MTNEKSPKRSLGRGLSALMAEIDVAPEKDTAPAAGKDTNLLIPIEKIKPNPDQPRRDFSEDALEDLANSIRTKGVIQPLIVREDPKDKLQYQIVAGERRWRAAQIAQLHELPAIIREFDDTEVLEVAIIENIQRADLNAIEEALGYLQLQEKFGHTQERLAEALGKSRSHIANLMRLLNLPSKVQSWLREGKLSAGHARALLSSNDPTALAQQVIAKSLSVRETEKLAKQHGVPSRDKPAVQRSEKDADTKALEGDLSAALGLKVAIDHVAGKDSGKLSIQYRNFAELDDLCRRLSGIEEN